MREMRGLDSRGVTFCIFGVLRISRLVPCVGRLLLSLRFEREQKGEGEGEGRRTYMACV